MKNAKANIGALIFVAVAVFALVWVVQGSNPFGTQSAAGGTSGAVNVKVTSDKNTATDTTVTVGPEYNELAPGTSASGVYHYAIVNDKVGAKKNITDSGTFTAKPGDTIQVYYGIESTTYYAKQGNKFTIPDTGAVNTIDYDGNKGLYALPSTTGMAITIWNDNDAVQANTNLFADSTNITMSAGDTKRGRVRIDGQYQRAFSPYAPIVAVCNYNSTANTYFHLMDANGVELPKYTGAINHITVNGTEQTQVKYQIPTIIGSGTTYIQYEVKADGTNGGGNIQTHPIWCTLSDADWYQDSNTGELKLGYETDANSDVGLTDGSYNFGVYIE